VRESSDTASMEELRSTRWEGEGYSPGAAALPLAAPLAPLAAPPDSGDGGRPRTSAVPGCSGGGRGGGEVRARLGAWGCAAGGWAPGSEEQATEQGREEVDEQETREEPLLPR
jgi:hypothetical protein